MFYGQSGGSGVRTNKTKKQDQVVPAADFQNLRDLLGSPPLLKGERLKDYQALEESLTATLKPSCAQEYIWVRDIVDLQWELRVCASLRQIF